MQKSQVTKLLTIIGALEGFVPDEHLVDAWHSIIGDLDYDDASAGLREHLRTNPQRTKPSHVFEAARKLRLRRINAGQEWRMNQ